MDENVPGIGARAEPLRFLDGRANEVVEDIRARMEAAAERLDFETAAMLRDQLRSLQAVLHKLLS